MALSSSMLSNVLGSNTHHLSAKCDNGLNAFAESKNDIKGFDQISLFEDYFPSVHCCISDNDSLITDQIFISDKVQSQAYFIHSHLRQVLYPFHSFW